MRRSVFVLTLIAACALALVAAPASAQIQDQNNWFANASIGPAFGTLGSTPIVGASAGYRLTPYVSLAGEFGVLPHAPFDKAKVIAPTPGSIASSDVHVNAYHMNANLFVQPAPVGRFQPYATVGIGAFTGSTVVDSVPGTSITQVSRDTNRAENLGVGTSYRLTKWLGLNADYRHFIVNATDTEHVNRFTTGVSLFVR